MRHQVPSGITADDAGIIVAWGGIRQATSASPAARPAPGAAPAAALDEGDAAPVTLGPRPRSLRGTRVDGGLAVDAAGRFMGVTRTWTYARWISTIFPPRLWRRHRVHSEPQCDSRQRTTA
jgi:hypothetical protein